jgi:hypothetical protein
MVFVIILFLFFRKALAPITRADIRQWFCTHEIPYGAFRSSNGQIYPWFHGMTSRIVFDSFRFF